MPRPLPERIARRRAAAVAGHQRDAAGARSHLDDSDPAVRATALGALARAGHLTTDDLHRGATDPVPAVRRRAAEVAAALEADGASDQVVAVGRATIEQLLTDADPTVVEVAAWAAGELLPPTEAAFGRLCELATTHDDALVREAAVAALGAVGDERALGTILEALGDKGTVRRRAVLALAPFDGPEVEAALEKARSDRDWQVRQNAEDLLAAAVVDLTDEDDDSDDLDDAPESP